MARQSQVVVGTLAPAYLRLNGCCVNIDPTTGSIRTMWAPVALALFMGSPFAAGAVAAENDATASSSASGKPGLQEIVVTARRKEEVLTEVPASITAYSSDFLEKQNIQSFSDYATRIPNLTFQYGQGSDFSATGFSGGRITTIRGVAGTNSTAYYLNDTPVPSSVSPETLDLDRIEVLKGPQGTLFGASSMGGNLRFITKRPSLTQNSYTLQMQGGGTQDGGPDFGGDGLANIVLVPDRISLHAAFGYTRESGFIKRRFPDASGNFVTKDGQGRDDEFSGSLALRIKLTERLETTFSAIGQITNLTGYPAAYVPLPGYKPLSYTLDRDRDVQEYSKDHWALGSFVLNYAGEGFSVVSSTSYFARQVREQEDATEGDNFFFENILGTPIGHPAFPSIQITHDRRITHESRISFDDGALLPHLSGIAGVFYQHLTSSWSQPPVIVPGLAEAGFSPSYINTDYVPYHEDNGAVFGEIYYNITPKLTLTLGLRQYWITQKTDPTLSTGVVDDPGGSYTPELRNRQSGLVPKGVVSYKIADEGNIYASVSKGFRPGGTQSPLPDFCSEDLAALGLTRDQVLHYKPDILWSYEIGAKNRFANGISLSSAAFQINWSSIQQTVLLPTCTYNFTTNAGKARIRGGEIEITGRPFADMPLDIQFGLGYTDGTLVDPGLIPQSPNSRLTQVPEWTGTVSGYYEKPLGDALSLFVAADYSYTGSVEVANGGGNFLTRQPFNILNGNIGVRFGRSQLLLYGKNLLDKRLNYGDLYASGFERQELLPDGSYGRLPRAAVSRPRQLGIQYRIDF